MQKKTSIFILLVLIIASLLIGCGLGLKVTRVTVQSFEIQESEAEKESAINSITNILVDRGFDVKMSNKEAGIVTTEYKKFASVGDNPPFDFYMQIKATVRPKAGKLLVKLSPVVKEQNRLNVAAFTEHELSYFTGDPKTIRHLKSMDPETGWRAQAMTMFNNVVSEVAKTFGLTFDDVIQNVTKTPEMISLTTDLSKF